MYLDNALIYNFLLFCDHESSCNHVKNQCSQTPMGLKTNCLLPCGVDRQKPGQSRLQILCSVMNRLTLRSYWRSCQLLSQKVRNISKQSIMSPASSRADTHHTPPLSCTHIFTPHFFLILKHIFKTKFHTAQVCQELTM